MMNIKSSFFKLSSIGALLLCSLFAPFSVSAAELFMSPPSGQFEVGETVLISVMLDPGEYSVNAAEAEIEFPDSIEVESVSTIGSAFNMWAEEPSVTEGDQSIFFSGGVSAPISGSTAELFIIKINSSSEGIKRIRIPSGAVMSADGTGSNVISVLQSAVYTFLAPPEEREPEPEYLAPEGAPGSLTINSPTHPEAEKWYPEENVVFEWDLPEGAEKIRAEINQKPSALPREIEKEAVDTLSFEDVPNGVWYFHLQIKNEVGWSEVSTRTVRIDTDQPERFEIRLSDRRDDTDPLFEVEVDSVDLVSGIDRFDLVIDDIYEESFPADSEMVKVGPIPPGTHNLIARAYNKAGIHRTASLVLEVAPIDPPVFTEVPNIIHSGSIMAFRGEASLGSEVIISIKRQGEEAETHKVKTDSNGIFTFIAPRKPDDGIYTIKAKTVDERGAESLYTDDITVAVEPPGVIKFGGLVLDGLTVLVSLLAVLVLLVFLIYWSVHKWRLFRKRLDKEIREAEEEVHQTFEDLRKKALYQLSLLREAEEHRELTEEERKIKEQIQKDMKNLGTDAEREVHDIKEAFDK